MSDTDYSEILDRYLAGDATPSDVAAIQQWLNERPDRPDELRLLQEAWRQAGRAAVADFEVKRAAFRARIAASVHQPAAHRTMVARSVIVAASPVRRIWMAAMAVTFAAALFVLGRGMWHTGDTSRIASSAESHFASEREIATRNGEHAHVALADGTTIDVGPASRLQIGRLGANGLREVRLDGEAYFNVIHAARHPFIVRVKQAAVQVLGTAFLVRGYDRDSSAVVTVATGKVMVQPSDDRQRGAVLVSGYRGTVMSGGNTVLRTDSASVLSELTAWLGGEMAFDETPVRDVAAAFERQYDVEIRIVDPRLLHKRINGIFADGTLEARLKLLGVLLNAEYTRHGRVVSYDIRP